MLLERPHRPANKKLLRAFATRANRCLARAQTTCAPKFTAIDALNRAIESGNWEVIATSAALAGGSQGVVRGAGQRGGQRRASPRRGDIETGLEV